MKTLFACLALIITLAWPGLGLSYAKSAEATSSGGAATPFAGWLDLAGTATVETVQQLAKWEPFTGWKGWAYGDEAVWLKVKVPAASADSADLVLIMRPPYLDQVVFHDPVLGIQRRAGDYFPATDDALDSVLFSFAIPAHPVERDVLLKLQSTSTRIVHLSLLPLSEARAYVRKVEWITGTVWVLSLVFLIWALVQWWIRRDPSMGIFAVKQSFITLWGFIFLGFARLSVGPWFDEGNLSLIGSIVVAGVIGSILWFFSALLVEYCVRPWMLNVMRATAWFFAALGLLNLIGHTRLSLQLVNSVGPLALLWIVLTLLFSRTQNNRPPIPKWLLLTYLSTYVSLNSLPALMHIGVLEESFILFVGNMSLLVFDGLIMLVILNIRQHRINQQHQVVSTQLMLQREQARLDQQHLDEQRKLLDMLAHELKTPLANLRIWMEAGPKGRPVMARAIRDMDRVIERCVHSGQLSDQRLTPRNEWLDAAELTHSVVSTSRNPNSVALQLPDDVCTLHTDAQMLAIVLSNLIENANKYSLRGTLIDLRLSGCDGPTGQPGWQWQIDNVVGEAGLPDSSRVFEKYYRSSRAQRQSGSGLGLFLVKSLVDLMQGTVTYAPVDGNARFTLWLPVEARAAQTAH